MHHFLIVCVGKQSAYSCHSCKHSFKPYKPQPEGDSAAVPSPLVVSVTLRQPNPLPGPILQYICQAKQVVAQGRKILKAAMIVSLCKWLQGTFLYSAGSEIPRTRHWPFEPFGFRRQGGSLCQRASVEAVLVVSLSLLSPLGSPQAIYTLPFSVPQKWEP